MPNRIQRKRNKGWRMPEGAVYVGRPSEWGNPYNTGNRDVDAEAYSVLIHSSRWIIERIKQQLRGKDLACWCPLGMPCHADILLEVANAD